MISYTDFDLRVQVDGDKLAISARRGTQTATEPFELDRSRSWDLRDLAALGPRELEAAGARLFDALIRGRVRDLYQQARGAAGGDASKGFRIRLLLDSRETRLRPILQLPWEILHDPWADAGGLPALDPRRPIVRMIDSMEETLPPVRGELKHILLALSNPHHSTPLALGLERDRIKALLRRVPIDPEVLQPATRANLERTLSGGGFQIVHFMGHGDMDADLGEGVLLLEDEEGLGDPLAASTFAGFFTGRPMPRLVILTACSSAETGSAPDCGPFASAAASLAAAGLPAVVAMQTAVTDRSALGFAERLYESVVQGNPIEAAVSDARRAVRADRGGGLDWAVPVLFMRGQVEEDPLGATESPIPFPQPGSERVGNGVGQTVNNYGPVGNQQNIDKVQSLSQSWNPREK